MRQLSALDAGLLDLESPTAPGHVGTLVGVDPGDAVGGWGAGQVAALLESRLPGRASLRRRLVPGPLGVGGWFLVEDPHFDLEFHVREVALPAPGTTQQLAEQVAAIHARPLDRRRPPWELHVLTGREGGRAAVYAKVHRALVDESSGDEVVQELLDTGSEPVPAGEDPPPGERAPSNLLREGLRSVLADPRRLGYAVPGSMHRLEDLAVDLGLPGAPLVGGLADAAGRLLTPRVMAGSGDLAKPRTRLDAALTPHRRLALGPLPAERVARVCAHHGLSVQEAVATVTASALRRWMLDHDALPDAPLVAVVPVATQTGGSDPDHAGIRISPVPVSLPTHLRDPADRAGATRDALRSATEQLDLVPAAAAQRGAAGRPWAPAGLTARTMSALALDPRASANVSVAHVIGPADPLHLAGAVVEDVALLAALGPATGGLAVTSYEHGGRLDVALTACREIVPDVWHLLGYLGEAVEELLPTG